MLQFIIIFTVFLIFFQLTPNIAVTFFALLWAGGVCCLLWLIGPMFGFPSYQSMSDASNLFITVFVISAIVGLIGMRNILFKN